ncbi:50S ribosomal protein L20 [Candidatus Peregrinibacteria bacterium]|nr:MAG: 50S ribosomal protein L20 [Candidatus Peregrinibacteria bacterium]
MPRVKRGVTTRRRHKKIIALAKGYKWTRKNVFKVAKQAVMKAGQNAYVGRKRKKRTFRSLWINRIQAGLRPLDLKYSRFIYQLQNKGIRLNRKILADLAAQHLGAFEAVVEAVKV